MTVTIIVGMDGHGGVTQHRLRTRRGDEQVLRWVMG